MLYFPRNEDHRTIHIYELGVPIFQGLQLGN